MKLKFIIAGFLFLISCDSGEMITPPEEDPVQAIYHIPVVVHVVHLGEPVGTGHNFSLERIESQIRVLNEDFRRKEGTPGFNNHPDGGDARIEFSLAKISPDGEPSNGIVRVDASQLEGPVQLHSFEFYGSLSYWNPGHYLNIWTEPMPDDLTDLVLGKATGPETDLPGADLFEPGEPLQPEGVLINSAHFGISALESKHNLGRTTTHEIGHYLGLLHPWGTGECETNDFCEDTPPVDRANTGVACDGRPVMAANYMNYAPDSVMNIFTNDQIARMHYVLENSPRRKSLSTSPAL